MTAKSQSGPGLDGYMGLVYNSATSDDYRKHFLRFVIPMFNYLPNPLQEKMRMGLRNYLFKFLTVPYTKSLEKYVDINFSRWQKLTKTMQGIHKMLKRVSASIFRSPGVEGAWGWSVGIGTSEVNFSFGYSFYEQIYPIDKFVPFQNGYQDQSRIK